MLHVYAAVSRPSGDMRGVDGRLLEFLPVEGLALAVSRHDEAPAPTAERLRAHARVNLALLGAPFRYGSHAADEDALRQQVRPDELRAKLDEVSGCVEYTIQLPAEPDDRASGRAYLEGKRRAYAQRTLLEERLQPAASAFKNERGRLVCLVPRQNVVRFKELAHGLKVSGPW